MYEVALFEYVELRWVNTIFLQILFKKQVLDTNCIKLFAISEA